MWSRAEQACQPRAEGPCADLAPDACEGRRDCEVINGLAGVWCIDRGLPCAQRPLEACEADLSCERFELDCLPEEGQDCGGEAICGPRGGLDGECAGIDDRLTCLAAGCEIAESPCACGPPEPCACPPGAECECADEPACDCPWLCVQPQAPVCEGLAPAACRAAVGCRVEQQEICGCAGGGDPDFAEPCVCRIEEVCVGERDGARCEVLDPRACAERRDCEWVDAPCECFVGPDGREECICGAVEPSCQPVGGPGGCWGLEERACAAADGCDWLPGGGGCGCWIEPDGREVCDCFEVPGECAPGGQGEGCWGRGIDNCEADPNCMIDWLPPPCPPCREGDADCPRCEPVPVCMDRPNGCFALAGDACDADPGCVRVEEEICFGDDPDCDDREGRCGGAPGEGFCERFEMCLPVADACGFLRSLDACAAAGCQPLEDGQRFVGCARAGAEGCWGLDDAQCGLHPDCAVVDGGGPGECWCEIDERGNEICGCAGGGPACFPADGGGFMPPPPPPAP